jgi:FtsH-binding integral membrane protein
MIHFPRPGRDAQWFYIIPLTDMLIFAVLIAFAYRDRRDSASHKRLIIIATAALMIAAVARWPSSIVHRHVIRAGLVSDVFLVMLIAYDLWALRKIHRSTAWAGAFLLVVQNARYAVGETAAWHSFAGWVQTSFR